MSYEKLEKFRCGGCGNDTYLIFKQQDNETDLFTKCIQCDSMTEITITKPRIELNWGIGADGMMCI